MIRTLESTWREGRDREEGDRPVRKKGGRRTPEPNRPPRPWQIVKKPKPFGLSKTDLDFLTANTHFDEKEIKGWYKGFKSDCPDGNLKREKILEVVQLILPPDEGEAFVDQIFRIFDKDGNGSIDFKEFMMATDMTSAGTPEEKLKWTFKLYDKDSSGDIDLSEMVDAIDTLYAMENMDKKGNISLRKAKKVFDFLDTNGDGRLSEEEFVQGCLADKDLVNMLSASSNDIAMQKELETAEKKKQEEEKKEEEMRKASLDTEEDEEEEEEMRKASLDTEEEEEDEEKDDEEEEEDEEEEKEDDDDDNSDKDEEEEEGKEEEDA